MSLHDLLVPGNVLHVFCEFTKPHPQPKILVLVSLNPRLLFFTINSKVNERLPAIVQRSHLPILRLNHAFLKYDSWIDCSKAVTVIDAKEISHQAGTGLCRLAGSMDETLRKQVKAFVNESVTLERRYITSIMADLPD